MNINDLRRIIREELETMVEADPRQLRFKGPGFDPPRQPVQQSLFNKNVLEPEVPVPGAPPPVAKPGREQYKIYGRKGNRPVHTRVKGVAFASGPTSRFKPNTKANVRVAGDQAVVTDPDDPSASQTWDFYPEYDPKTESLARIIRQLVREALSK